jgi:hypothetical protein
MDRQHDTCMVDLNCFHQSETLVHPPSDAEPKGIAVVVAASERASEA